MSNKGPAYRSLFVMKMCCYPWIKPNYVSEFVTNPRAHALQITYLGTSLCFLDPRLLKSGLLYGIAHKANTIFNNVYFVENPTALERAACCFR